jgi:hypothetical protein
MRWCVLLLGAAAMASLAACGSSSPPAAAANNDGANGFAAYTQCLARNGVVLPSFSANPRGSRSPGARPSNRPSTRPSGGFGGGNGGGFGGGNGGGFGAFGDQPPAGVDQATWDKARQACASVLPSQGTGGRANNSELVAYRNCLSEHGVTFPSGGTGGGFGGLNTADPKVAAALQACAPLRPTGGPGGPRPTPTPTR